MIIVCYYDISLVSFIMSDNFNELREHYKFYNYDKHGICYIYFC